MHIGILGSGVIGLTTALELQNEYRNAQITIIADKFYNDTVSYVAAGIFRPGTAFTGPTEEITKKWIYDSYQHWDDIRKKRESSEAGICQISGYIFSSINESITRVSFVSLSYQVITNRRTICVGNLFAFLEFINRRHFTDLSSCDRR